MSEQAKTEILKLITQTLSTLKMIRKTTTWYFPSEGYTSFFNLQKSQWSCYYYVNCGAFLVDLTSQKPLPPEYKADIRLRVLRAVSEEPMGELDRCFNFANEMTFNKRSELIKSFLDNYIVNLIQSLQSQRGVISLYQSGILKEAFITVEARSKVGIFE